MGTVMLYICQIGPRLSETKRCRCASSSKMAGLPTQGSAHDTHLWNRQCCCKVNEEIRSDVLVCNPFRICNKLTPAEHYGGWINICSEKPCGDMSYEEHVDRTPKICEHDGKMPFYFHAGVCALNS